MLRQCSRKLAWIKHSTQVMELHVPTPEPQSQSTSIVGKLSGIQRMVSYKKLDGLRNPGIIYISGFMSGMAGKKPTALHSFCHKYGFPYIRYDATGLGESANEVQLAEGRFTHWLEDAEHMLLNHTEGPQLVIGSSMGAWISSILVQKHPEKFHSLLLIAPAVNFASRYMKTMSEKLPPTVLEKLNRGEVFNYFNPDYGSMPLSLSLFHDMQKHQVDLEKGIVVNCPVKIIHGMKDKDSPYMNSLDLVKAYETEDVELLYIKNGEHWLSEPNDLEVIYDTILRMTTSSSKM
ncbi:palmitoyl-protein thioesterase ABHD10, mitochondrial-like isoform X2 [Oratosquilla oratoria]